MRWWPAAGPHGVPGKRSKANVRNRCPDQTGLTLTSGAPPAPPPSQRSPRPPKGDPLEPGPWWRHPQDTPEAAGAASAPLAGPAGRQRVDGPPRQATPATRPLPCSQAGPGGELCLQHLPHPNHPRTQDPLLLPSAPACYGTGKPLVRRYSHRGMPGDSQHPIFSALDRNTSVLLFSDGWETGDPDHLARELAKLRKKVRQLVWLNPLLGTPDYAPMTLGLKAAGPHVDLFASALNLAQLKRLPKLLRHNNNRPRRFEISGGGINSVALPRG